MRLPRVFLAGFFVIIELLLLLRANEKSSFLYHTCIPCGIFNE